MEAQMSKITYGCTDEELDDMLVEAVLDTAKCKAAIQYMISVYTSSDASIQILEKEKARREQMAKKQPKQARGRKLPKPRKL
jgi:methionine synthase I (cobalamin-dependent)